MQYGCYLFSSKCPLFLITYYKQIYCLPVIDIYLYTYNIHIIYIYNCSLKSKWTKINICLICSVISMIYLVLCYFITKEIALYKVASNFFLFKMDSFYFCFKSRTIVKRRDREIFFPYAVSLPKWPELR